jgi:tetratricopeptide (TPR) repeat protein
MRAVYRLACFLLCGLSCCGTASGAITQAEAEYNEGKALAKKGQFRKALLLFDDAARMAPNVAAIYAERGSAYLNLEQREKALDDLNRAIKLDPKNFQPYVDRARCQYELHDCRASIDDVSRAISLDPDKCDRCYRYRERALYYLDLGDTKKALDDLNTSISLRQDFYTNFMRGDLFYKLKRYKEAVADYTIGLKQIKPTVTYMDYWYEQRARAYDKLGESKLAAQDRSKARVSHEVDPYYKFVGPKEDGGWELPSGLGKTHQ